MEIKAMNEPWGHWRFVYLVLYAWSSQGMMAEVMVLRTKTRRVRGVKLEMLEGRRAGNKKKGEKVNQKNDNVCGFCVSPGPRCSPRDVKP